MFFGKVVGTDKRVARVSRILFKNLFYNMYRVVGIDARVIRMLFKKLFFHIVFGIDTRVAQVLFKKLIFDRIVRIDARVVQVPLCVERLVH